MAAHGKIFHGDFITLWAEERTHMKGVKLGGKGTALWVHLMKNKKGIKTRLYGKLIA